MRTKLTCQSAHSLLHDLCTQHALFGCYFSNLIHVCLLSVMLYFFLYKDVLNSLIVPPMYHVWTYFSMINCPIVAHQNCSAIFLFNLLISVVGSLWILEPGCCTCIYVFVLCINVCLD